MKSELELARDSSDLEVGKQQINDLLLATEIVPLQELHSSLGQHELLAKRQGYQEVEERFGILRIYTESALGVLSFDVDFEPCKKEWKALGAAFERDALDEVIDQTRPTLWTPLVSSRATRLGLTRVPKIGPWQKARQRIPKEQWATAPRMPIDIEHTRRLVRARYERDRIAREALKREQTAALAAAARSMRDPVGSAYSHLRRLAQAINRIEARTAEERKLREMAHDSAWQVEEYLGQLLLLQRGSV